jgi:anti-sigma B factor antagonist
MREAARMPASSHDPSSLFAIKASSDKDTTTIAVSGELDIASADRLREAIRSAENGTTRWIILDLEELTFMDSTGLSALLEARRRPSLNGDRLRFVHSRHGQVKRLLSITETSETIS